ncbi:hypothetical protein [Roseateles sp. LKC17W]|uniref:Lipoprotein n=1 Tax=Pelomonas margarita TaxID=3299031 RepID=A0ABW7FDH5_9BURK
MATTSRAAEWRICARHIGNAALLATTFVVTGCALTPSVVEVPEKPAAGKTWAQKQADDKGLLRIPKTTEVTELQGQLAVYAGFWRGVEGDLLLGMRDIPGRARDLAVLWAAYEAVKSNFRSARYAGIGAALFGSVSSTYKVEVQAQNYQTAADAMDCIATEVERVPLGAWKFFNRAGEFTGVLDSADAAAKETAQLELNDVFPAVNRSMNLVLTKLIRAQRNDLKLTGVNLEELRGAYDREKAVRDKVIPVKTAAGVMPLFAATNEDSSVSDDVRKARTTALRLLRLNAAKCVASTAG